MNTSGEQDPRVVKLGGSLLDLPDLANRLDRWLAAQSAASNVMVVGGGRLADVVRAYDRLHCLGECDAHWLAIRTMEINSRIVASLLPGAQWLDSLGPCEECAATLAILDPWNFMRNADVMHPAGPLPASWGVTSDSIAARVAELSRAGELVLLKSALPPEPATKEAAVTAGYVDPFFLEASRLVRRIRCVNLRDDQFSEVDLCSRSGT